MTSEQPTVVPTSATYPNGSLYVGDLRQDVGESDIYDAFKECGAILSVRVCRDVKDQRSLGYAYVNFQSPEHAQKALDTLNGKSLKGKPCRVMWSRRDPSQRKSNEGNLFVKSLDKSVTLVQLQDVFSHFGAISSCKVVTKDDGTSLCYGFVQFDKVEDSLKALEASKTDKEQFSALGEKLVVEKFVPKHLRANNANETFTNVYVKNIGKNFTTDDLLKMFSEFGKITSPVIMTNKEGESRCFGFVNFENHADAVKAKEAMDGKTFKWKDDSLVGPVEEGEDEEQLKKDGFTVLKMYVNRAQKKHEREASQRYDRNLHDKPTAKTNIYIRNLADSVTDEDLRNLFKDYGVIKSAVVMRHPNEASKGFGFCDFATPESASEAIQKVMGHVFHGKPLYVALAQRKADRHAMLESQRNQQRSMIPPGMSGMYRQQMFPPNFGYISFPPNMYGAYVQRPNMSYPRQPQYQRPFHNRPNQGRRPNKQQVPMQQPVQMQPQQPQPPVQPQPAPAANPEAEKQSLGEAIYARIMPMFPNDQQLWGKLTGMLLESISLPELQSLVNDQAGLTEKINQAKEYYDQHVEQVSAQ